MNSCASHLNTPQGRTKRLSSRGKQEKLRRRERKKPLIISLGSVLHSRKNNTMIIEESGEKSFFQKGVVLTIWREKGWCPDRTKRGERKSCGAFI